MAVAFRDKSGVGATSLTAPATRQAGDVLVVMRSDTNQGTAENYAAPTGWTLAAAASVNFAALRAYTRTADGTSADDFTTTATTDSAMVMLAYSGALLPAITANNTGTDSTAEALSVTLNNAGGMAVFAWCSTYAGEAMTAPTGTTSRVLMGNRTTRVADEPRSAAGATDVRTVNISAAGTWSALTVGLSQPNPPDAPLLLAPVGGVTIDRNIIQRFDWDFSDPDLGDSQSKYDVQYRAVGAATWTVVTGTTPNTFHDFAAGTFAAGDWEWQVRTYDSYGIVGPYSASGFFTAANAPAGPTITDPISGQTIAATPYTVVWSYPTQEAYQLRTVADLAGVADTVTVYTDTGIVESPTARSRSVSFPVNNRNEHVQVRVRDAGLWSPYTSVRVLVSYTPPAVPTATVLASNSSAAVSVAISNPTPAAGEPSVAYNDVLRRQTAVGGDGIRIATNKSTNSTHIDFTPASGVDYEYAVRAVADNGTASISAWLAGTSTPDNITDYAGY
jgi:hypothetical protein